MLDSPYIFVPLFSVGMAIAFYMLFRSEKQVSASYLKTLLSEREQQKKDKLLEQLKGYTMDINELTPDEIELIKRKRAAESTSNTPGRQERSFELSGRKINIVNESFVDVVIQHSDRSYIEVDAENEEACKLITTDLRDDSTVAIGLVSESVGCFSVQGNNSSVTIGNIRVGTNHGQVAQIFHGKVNNVIGVASAVNGMVFRQAPKVTIHVPRTLTEIELTQKGSGSITASHEIVDANASVSLSLSGSGDIAISGKCENLTAQLSGSGDINTQGLVATNGVVNLVGSGDLICNVTGSLSANLVGSGNIKVFGSPSKKHLNKVGSGRIVEV